jgi:hypothetical protein
MGATSRLSKSRVALLGVFVGSLRSLGLTKAPCGLIEVREIPHLTKPLLRRLKATKKPLLILLR